MAFRVYEPRLSPSGPVVALTTTGFRFNVEAARLAGLHDPVHWVRVSLDHEQRRIGFRFFSGETRPSNTLKLKGLRGRYYRFSAKGVIWNVPWIHAVSKQDSAADRNFKMERLDSDRNRWVIRLAPWFECKASPNDVGSLGSKEGIYRYRDASDRIIYIGKGKIADRFREHERRDWGIEWIEYSEIEGDENQFDWESFHLDRYEETHDALPPRNRSRGRSS